MVEWWKKNKVKKWSVFDKLEKVKKKKNYGITNMRICESTLYPDLVEIGQEVCGV